MQNSSNLTAVEYQRKVLALHDLSCFGRSSLVPITAVLSAMGHQCVPAPTAVFSTHTAIPGWVCTDLTQAGMSAVATEAPLLVTPDSVGMLSDIAASAYARVEVVGEDGETSLSFMVDDQARALLSLFLEEYEQEIVPMLSDGSSLLRVYDALTPVITAEDADDLTAEAQAIRAAEYAELQNGSTGDEVAQLQQMLVNLGYLSGGVDGIFGGNTASAIEAFQQSAGLEATGVADANTQAALYLAGLFEGFSLEAPAEEPAESAE